MKRKIMGAPVNISGKPEGHGPSMRTLVGARIESHVYVKDGPAIHSIDCSSKAFVCATNFSACVHAVSRLTLKTKKPRKAQRRRARAHARTTLSGCCLVYKIGGLQNRAFAPGFLLQGHLKGSPIMEAPI